MGVAAGRAGAGRWRDRPLAVGLAVLVAYSAWIGFYLSRHHSALAFVHIGRQFALAGDPPPAIRAAAADRDATDVGYDGQFAYYIAVDLGGAWRHMDAPAYRYARLGYPLAARLAALGIAALVPWTMLALNLAAVAAGAWALAAWLRERGASPWWALVYGFYPGLFIAVQNDLTEVTAYSLAAVGALLLARAGPPTGAAVAGERPAGFRRFVGAGAVFGVAGLSRETALLFPAVYAAARALTAWRAPAGSRRRPAMEALALAALGVLPALLWRQVAYAIFGSGGGQAEVARVPFGGLLSFLPFEPREWIEVPAVALPALLLLVMAVVALLRRAPAEGPGGGAVALRGGEGVTPARATGGTGSAELVLVILNALLVVFLQRSSWFSYYDSGRVSTGLVLAALLALPALRARLPATRILWPVVVLLWLSAVPPGLLAPHAFHALKL